MGHIFVCHFILLHVIEHIAHETWGCNLWSDHSSYLFNWMWTGLKQAFINMCTLKLTWKLSLQNYTKAMRLFVGEPVWKAYNRPADEFEIRQKYVASLQGSWERGFCTTMTLRSSNVMKFVVTMLERKHSGWLMPFLSLYNAPSESQSWNISSLDLEWFLS